jgi:hypothetical protein
VTGIDEGLHVAAPVPDATTDPRERGPGLEVAPLAPRRSFLQESYDDSFQGEYQNFLG